MSGHSIKANDRTMNEWFDKIKRGEIKLPRFQRPESWDRKRVSSLLNTIIHNLPLGITLILDVNKNNEPFVSRFLSSAPEVEGTVSEHLLDGQQRLTAFWKALHNNYEWESFFVYNSDFDKSYKYKEKLIEVRFAPRWYKEEIKRPLWADIPNESLTRGLIPLNLFIPGDNSREYENWVVEAISNQKPNQTDPDAFKKIEEWNRLKDSIVSFIRDKKEIIKHYNLPYLSLPVSTPQEIALQVFINMNTNSKPLSQYDIIRAEIEGVKGISLDELQHKLNEDYPTIHHYFELPFLILSTSALIQDKLPNQRGMWDMKKDVMVSNWDIMVDGLSKMVIFLEEQGILDKKRLPTNAVLAVIAALYTHIPESLDARGKSEILLKKYLWSSFFTDRYENSAASHAYNDFIALKRIIKSYAQKGLNLTKETDVPVLNRNKYPLSTLEELTQVGWPKRENIRARAIMAVSYKLGAYDFADGSKLNRSQLIQGKRQYHHIFPDSLIKHLDVNPNLALNCSLISDRTNLNISNKEPLVYLKERYKWMDQEVVNTRLKSHLIPIKELENGGYENLSKEDKDQKLIKDYRAFINKRAAYMIKAAEYLCQGKEIVPGEIINEVEELEKTVI